MDLPQDRADEHQGNSLRERIWRIIFLTGSGWSRVFDVVLLVLIAGSVIVVMLESVDEIREQYGAMLRLFEWIFTIIFTIEYIVRIWVVRRKARYIFSFFGIVDLLSILPTYIDLFMVGSGHFIIIRILRLLRMFRILKMAEHIGEANILLNALKASRSKIAVFIFGICAIVCIEGTMMYLIEDAAGNEGFSSIPQSVYWGIVTITTVGYGDIAPITVMGKILASIMMLTGFAILAVPTGIVTAELNRTMAEVQMDTRKCAECGHDGHDPQARHCKMCGHGL